MKDAGRNSQTLTDQLGFLLTDYVNKNRIAKLGLHAKFDNYNKLGELYKLFKCEQCPVCRKRYFCIQFDV